jgi:hypothetical protein
MQKKQSLTFSIPQRLEGLADIVLAVALLMFLTMSLHTLYQFPVIDGYRWYGDETWMLLAWKSLLVHGRMMVPIALGSQLLSSPGFLLGSPWLAALVYGIPQVCVHPDTDIVDVGRMVSFILGIGMLLFLGWTGYRFRVNVRGAILAIVLLATTRNFTFATHSARYDILTGLALLAFIGIFAMLLPNLQGHHLKSRWGKNTTCFIIGLSGVILAFTISPHLEALLPPIAVYTSWRFGAFRKIKATIAFVSGGTIAMALLILLYVIFNHSFSIAEGIATDNQFGSVLNILPFHHLLSRSAQSHQLWAKGFYLWNEAPAFAFLLPLIFISEVVLLITKRSHPATVFVTGSLFLALIVAMFVQSTLPYYLIHILPLATLAFTLHLEQWSKFSWTAPMIAWASLAVAAVIVLRWIPELDHAGQMGKRIDEANTAAIQAAIEGASRDWEPGHPKPLVLAQAPAIHELLRDTAIRVMSESFLFFPVRRSGDHGSEPIDSVLSRAGVNYIIDYDKPMTTEYETAVRHGKAIFSRVGPMLDRTVDYFSGTLNELDTLTLYQLDSLQ